MTEKYKKLRITIDVDVDPERVDTAKQHAEKLLDKLSGIFTDAYPEIKNVREKKIEEQSKFTEIFKLREMLEKANIPFTYKNENEGSKKYDHHHITCCDEGLCDPYISVIQGEYTYGGRADLLEIMGLLTPEESKNESVLGFLTAEEVFNRIKTHLNEPEKLSLKDNSFPNRYGHF